MYRCMYVRVLAYYVSFCVVKIIVALLTRIGQIIETRFIIISTQLRTYFACTYYYTCYVNLSYILALSGNLSDLNLNLHTSILCVGFRTIIYT